MFWCRTIDYLFFVFKIKEDLWILPKREYLKDYLKIGGRKTKMQKMIQNHSKVAQRCVKRTCYKINAELLRTEQGAKKLLPGGFLKEVTIWALGNKVSLQQSMINSWGYQKSWSRCNRSLQECWIHKTKDNCLHIARVCREKTDIFFFKSNWVAGKALCQEPNDLNFWLVLSFAWLWVIHMICSLNFLSLKNDTSN